MSSQYLVSARKYRPQTFDTVVGQEHITTTLKNAIRTDHLAHAFLFCGPRGVGKTTCARILAKTINCEHPTPEIEACGECASCKSFQENASFNVFELDAASNNSVDDIRELVNQVRFAPQQGRYKIYIIDEVHMLSAAAFNAFLKTLEEPPPYAIFILATTEKHKILPTILSRCQIFDFKRITTADTVRHLQSIATKEGLDAEEAALHVISQKSEGCMRDSLSMLDRIASFTSGHVTYAATMEHLAMLDADFYFYLTDAMLAQDISTTLLQLDAVLEKGFEGAVVLEGLAEHFRNLLLCKDARMAKLLDVPQPHKRKYHEKALQAPPSFILSALNVLNDSELHYKEATNKRLHTELCLIRLCYLLQAIGAASLTTDEYNKSSLVGATPDAGIPIPSVWAPSLNLVPSQLNEASKVAPGPPIASPQEVTAYQLGFKSSEPEPVVAPQPEKQPLPEIEEPPKVEEPPKIEEPATVQPKPVVAPARPVAPAPQPEGRRVSSNMLKDLDATLNSVPTLEQIAKDLCQEDAERIFTAYRDRMLGEGRSVIAAQLGMMRIECVAPDEVRLISPNEMTDSYVQNLRNELIEFFTTEAGRHVRVTSEIRCDERAEAEMPKVLSKQELFEEMAKKNPLVKTLKEGLNLQIDF